MEKVRVGVIGLGNMGFSHFKEISAGLAPNCVVGAICDIDQGKITNARKLAEVPAFTDSGEMIRSGLIDAVIIATPHYSHPPIAIDAFANGLHVLCEKPAGVYTRQVAEMNAAAVASGKQFAIMFQTRTNPVFAKVKDMLTAGEIGDIQRVVLIITKWLRTQKYYNMGDWRATWAGEGGGVLLNQDPHQLDLLQWLCGMPSKISATCFEGKYHNIEVEDDVTAIIEYPSGATGAFITSTGEYPGGNRWEISGDKGKLVVEDDTKITFYRSHLPVAEYIRTSQEAFKGPGHDVTDIKAEGDFTQHMGIVRNFCDAIQSGAPLIAPGYEGINGLTLSNAMHLSAWTGAPVTLPIDEDLFYTKLQEKIKNSRFVKPEESGEVIDLTGSH